MNKIDDSKTMNEQFDILTYGVDLENKDYLSTEAVSGLEDQVLKELMVPTQEEREQEQML